MKYIEQDDLLEFYLEENEKTKYFEQYVSSMGFYRFFDYLVSLLKEHPDFEVISTKGSRKVGLIVINFVKSDEYYYFKGLSHDLSEKDKLVFKNL